MGADVVADYRRARRMLGVVPQELVFDPFFTVRETLRIQSGYFGIRNNDAWIDEVMEHLDLTAKADANMRSLSGGMKRRVLVAQALVHKPPVIVLDEPTAGVDVELRQGLWQFVRRLNRDGHTIVLTTHYLEEAEAHCSRIAMLKAGRVVALDSTAQPARSASPARALRLRAGSAAADGIPARSVARPARLRLKLENAGSRARAGELREAGRRDRRPGARAAPTSRMSSCGSRRDEMRMTGFSTLFYKEMLRFWKVSVQTVAAPVLTALLYLVIFGHALEGRAAGVRRRRATPRSWCRAW